MRAFLTVLGMVIGVASIVVMVSLGIGIRQATVESFAGTGSLTTIRVSSCPTFPAETAAVPRARRS
jgi:ABC-type antimicrobial peptide transport system permease subunit